LASLKGDLSRLNEGVTNLNTEVNGVQHYVMQIDKNVKDSISTIQAHSQQLSQKMQERIESLRVRDLEAVRRQAEEARRIGESLQTVLADQQATLDKETRLLCFTARLFTGCVINRVAESVCRGDEILNAFPIIIEGRELLRRLGGLGLFYKNLRNARSDAVVALRHNLSETLDTDEINTIYGISAVLDSQKQINDRLESLNEEHRQLLIGEADVDQLCDFMSKIESVSEELDAYRKSIEIITLNRATLERVTVNDLANLFESHRSKILSILPQTIPKIQAAIDIGEVDPEFLKDLDQALMRSGMKRILIEIGSTRFNPELHQAIGTEDNTGYPPQMVVSVIGAGFVVDKEQVVKAKVFTARS
jgi:molecular chaperone GrpE (heat shock protein)